MAGATGGETARPAGGRMCETDAFGGNRSHSRLTVEVGICGNEGGFGRAPALPIPQPSEAIHWTIFASLRAVPVWRGRPRHEKV